MMNEQIGKILEFIRLHDTKSEFTTEIKIIRDTEYKVKEWYAVWKEASTTLGKRTVRLQSKPNFFELSLQRQSSTLIHEAVHQLQFEKLGKPAFYTKYLLQHFSKGYWGNSFEQEARARQLEWNKVIGIT